MKRAKRVVPSVEFRETRKHNGGVTGVEGVALCVASLRDDIVERSHSSHRHNSYYSTVLFSIFRHSVL